MSMPLGVRILRATTLSLWLQKKLEDILIFLGGSRGEVLKLNSVKIIDENLNKILIFFQRKKH